MSEAQRNRLETRNEEDFNLLGRRKELHLLLALVTSVTLLVGASIPGGLPPRDDAERLFREGHFKEAYEAYRSRVWNPADRPRRVGEDLERATECLRRLGRVAEMDSLWERALEVNGDRWRLLWAAAKLYRDAPHHGTRVAGEFQRGNRRDRQPIVQVFDRDRVRALQLMRTAHSAMARDTAAADHAAFFLDFARTVLRGVEGVEAWRLQTLTDLGTLPDFEPGWSRSGRRTRPGAPVDREGQPIQYGVPQSFEEATDDGQRWRWALMMASRASPEAYDEALWERAEFLRSQFGVETLGYLPSAPDDGNSETHVLSLETLGENETVARLAVGIRRFTLPDEFNPIRLYEEIAARKNSVRTRGALRALAEIFENRRQYARAAIAWRRLSEEDPGGGHEARLAQIIGNWGRFEPLPTQSAGDGARVGFRFRNATEVEFEAYALDVEGLVADVKSYLRGSRGRIDRRRVRVHDLGYRLVAENQIKYRGERVATWRLTLKPRPNHGDRSISVATPLENAGAYLLSARLPEGNTSHVIVWIADTVIVTKRLDGRSYYFVADAATGKPLGNARLEFFGYEQRRTAGRNYETRTLEFERTVDAEGQVIVSAADQTKDARWLVTARTTNGRSAHLGFGRVWYPEPRTAEAHPRDFVITDRPVYRPGDAVQVKVWIDTPRYDEEAPSPFAEQEIAIEVFDSRHEKIYEATLTADAWGGLSTEVRLPPDARLGAYRIGTPHGGGTFRVEEYKKPEFEVTVEAPAEPVRLGDRILATIRARYYFGAPVTEATVRYKVLRTPTHESWFPVRRWDWLYGPGYAWHGYDYEGYPGWERWGCPRPSPWWRVTAPSAPELVAEREVPIGADGTVALEIDTALAREFHGQTDHIYGVTAEVVDRSRRTIVGSGTVYASRQPFKVFAWTHRGYYRTGDTIEASFFARTVVGRAVSGTGRLELFRIRYDDRGEPTETSVERWTLRIGGDNETNQKLTAAAPGQYRLACTLTDTRGHSEEGATIFSVLGTGATAGDFRFNALELTPDRAEYRPGDTVKLLVSTAQPESTVILFLRPTDGVYQPPQLLPLTGRRHVVDIGISHDDMPNFFVEAFTIRGGKLHTEVRLIAVPPEDRVLNVEIEPTASELKPGATGAVTLRVTDVEGAPFTGPAAVAIYDKSIDAIAGGSNVPEIRSYFWSWRRHHYPHQQTSLDRTTYNVVSPGEVPMQDVGIFGGPVPTPAGSTQNALKGRLRAGAAMEFGAAEAVAELAAEEAPGAAGGESPLVAPKVRKDFADTALWIPALLTDEYGHASFEVTMPENLTTWNVKVWCLGRGTRVGEGIAEVVTRKNLLLRLQAPRFFSQNDTVTLSANVHNYLGSAKEVEARLEIEGDTVAHLGTAATRAMIASGAEHRFDWQVRVRDEGEVTVRMLARTDEESDAVEMRFPVHVHGMERTEAVAGTVRPEHASARIPFTVPDARRPDASRLELRFSPSLAGALVDALPYLVDYPYGCTEQTLNRFLPTVVTQRTLLDLGLDLRTIREKRTNLNPQEPGSPGGRARDGRRHDRNPVFDEETVRDMVREGLRRLIEMQLDDGGWGWFSGWGERSDPHTTATVVHGLRIAAQNEVAVPEDVLNRGIAWLTRYEAAQLRALENAPSKTPPYKSRADSVDAWVARVLVTAGVGTEAMLGFLYRDRTELPVYAQALVGLALAHTDDRERLATVRRNLEQFLLQDDENDTAYLDLGDRPWWLWYGSDIEANAAYLSLLARCDPQSSVAPRVVKYLLNNRKHATYWQATRDTALCIEALAAYLRASGEDRVDMTVEVWLDGEKRKEIQITSENFFAFDNAWILSGDAVPPGKHTLELRRRGRGPVYYNFYLSYFSLEDPIHRAGLELKVNRRIYRLERNAADASAAGDRGEVRREKIEKYRRVDLANLSSIQSGELLEVELEIETKNDYEYLVFEDLKAAGCEAVDLRSGYSPNPLGAYMELRDRRVSFFVRHLPRGRHVITYRLRAEIPGAFSALPTVAYAMYAPELRGNSDEAKIVIDDSPR